MSIAAVKYFELHSKISDETIEKYQEFRLPCTVLTSPEQLEKNKKNTK